MSYRDNAICSIVRGGTTYQAACWWNSASKLIIGVRTIGGAWTLYTYNGGGGLPDIGVTDSDDHRSAVVVFDKNGILHTAYDHHSDALKYAVADAAIESWTGGLTTGLAMLGTNETSVGYPTFFNDQAGGLYVIFRDGISGNGDGYFYAYDEVAGWAAATGTGAAGLLWNGKGAVPDAESQYHYQPVFDASGNCHFAWHWRDDADPGGNTNHDVSYVLWNGTTFEQSDGTAQTVPILPTNSESTVAIAQGNGLCGRGGIALDNNSNPHIVYTANDASGYGQVYHIWHNGTAWQAPAKLTDAEIASTGDPVTSDTMSPTVAISTAGRCYVLWQGYAKKGLYVHYADSPYTSWPLVRLYAADLGEYAPAFDLERWRRDGVLDILLADWYLGADFEINLLSWMP